jgi:hypothetical protein
MVSRTAVALFHILPKGFNVIPGASDLHEPMKIVVDAAGIRFIDLDYR